MILLQSNFQSLSQYVDQVWNKAIKEHSAGELLKLDFSDTKSGFHRRLGVSADGPMLERTDGRRNETARSEAAQKGPENDG